MKVDFRFVCLLGWALAAPLQAVDTTDRAREIFEAGGGKVRLDESLRLTPGGGVGVELAGPGVRYWYEHHIGGRRGSVDVSPAYRFCHGDRVTLHLEGNRGLQVLALGRATRIGGAPAADPEASLGAEEAPPVGSMADGVWRLLQPTGGRSVELAAGETLSVPGDGWVLSDEAESIEIAVIVSTEALDLSEHFDLETGGALEGAAEALASSGVRRSGGLESTLDGWRRNAAQSRAQGKGIHSYAFQLASSGPALIDVPLIHDPCFRRMTLLSRSSHSTPQDEEN